MYFANNSRPVESALRVLKIKLVIYNTNQRQYYNTIVLTTHTSRILGATRFRGI